MGSGLSGWSPGYVSHHQVHPRCAVGECCYLGGDLSLLSPTPPTLSPVTGTLSATEIGLAAPPPEWRWLRRESNLQQSASRWNMYEGPQQSCARRRLPSGSSTLSDAPPPDLRPGRLPPRCGPPGGFEGSRYWFCGLEAVGHWRCSTVD